MIVLECRRRTRLAQETLFGRVTGGQAGQHGLEGDETLQLGVLSTEDNAHAARSQHLENTVGTESAQLIGSLWRSQEIVMLLVRVSCRLGLVRTRIRCSAQGIDAAHG